jgi:hypothetical protein|tara:strand:+ start:373 stop:582 length:210 start_codon:yes stop_codon:yes gene_type:complete
MTTYEVRVTHSYSNYHHIEANSKDEAIALIREEVIEKNDFIDSELNDTIDRTPVVDYALELDKKGELIL